MDRQERPATLTKGEKSSRSWWPAQRPAQGRKGLGYLPGGHLPPPKFGHLPPQKKNICQEDNCHPQFFFFLFWRIFLGFFDLQLMEDIKDGKEEVLDEVVMEHIK